jgi:chromosome segregation ATPase
MNDGIAKELDRWNVTAGDLTRAAQASQDELVRLEKQRSSMILSARTGNKDAQAQAAALDTEIEKLRRYVRDDKEALAQARAKCDELSALFAAAERERERVRVKALVASRAEAKLERRACELVLQLDEVLEQIRRDNSRVAHEVRMFDPGLTAIADRLSSGLMPIDAPRVLEYGHKRRRQVLQSFPADVAARFQGVVAALEEK